MVWLDDADEIDRHRSDRQTEDRKINRQTIREE